MIDILSEICFADRENPCRKTTNPIYTVTGAGGKEAIFFLSHAMTDGRPWLRQVRKYRPLKSPCTLGRRLARYGKNSGQKSTLPGACMFLPGNGSRLRQFFWNFK